MLVNLLFFTYIPQVAFLALFHGLAGAWLNGTILVLSEGAVVVAILFEAFFVDETQVDVFDAVGLDSYLLMLWLWPSVSAIFLLYSPFNVKWK